MNCRHLMVAVVLATTISCTPSPGISATAEPGEAIVVRVVDGDTIVAFIGSNEERVRLIGIDTPEIAHPPEPAECFGPEASAFLKTLLPPGTRILLSRDVESRDRYDRLLAYLIREADDLDVNLALLQHGYAEVLSIAPNTTRTDEFARAESGARAAARGLWSAC